MKSVCSGACLLCVPLVGACYLDGDCSPSPVGALSLCYFPQGQWGAGPPKMTCVSCPISWYTTVMGRTPAYMLAHCLDMVPHSLTHTDTHNQRVIC